MKFWHWFIAPDIELGFFKSCGIALTLHFVTNQKTRSEIEADKIIAGLIHKMILYLVFGYFISLFV